MKAFLHTIVARLLGFLRPKDFDPDFDRELEAHLAVAAEDKIQRGMSPEQARRMARMELGGLAQLREAARAARGLPWLGGFWLDVKLGLRMLRKSWGLTLVGGLAMAVAIGLGTSVFAIWNALVGTTLPLADGDRVVAIQPWDAATQTAHRDTPLADFRRWRDVLRSVTDIGATRRTERNLITPDGPAGRVSVAEMSASGFQLARVQPLLGRPLIQDDERSGAEPVVVIGHDLWQSGFSADAAVLGRRLQLDGTFHAVVGVMPQDFAFPVNQRIWTTLRSNPLDYAQDQEPEVFVFARLAPGVTLDGAQAEVTTIGMLPPDAVAEANEHLQPRVVPYAAGVFTDVPSNRWIGGLIFFLVALLLVPPCANIAILVYARTVTRAEEFAARYALGASRGRIVLQIFVEVLVLAAAAGIAGFLFARQFAGQLSRIVLPGSGPQNAPFWMDFSPSFKTVLWAAGLVVLAAAIAGGVPALQATGRRRQAGLQSLRTRGTGMRLGKTWTALLALQVALSLAVLPSALEMTWGIFRPSILGPEFAIEEFLTGWLMMEGSDTSRFGNLQAEVVGQLETQPGLSGMTVSAAAVMEEPQADIEVEGSEAAASQAAINHVDDVFFDLFDARFLAGRGFDAGDFEPGRTTVIVNRSFVEEVVSDGNPLGRRVRYGPRGDGGPVSEARVWYEIVGVVDDFPSNNDRPMMYHPMAPGTMHPVSLALRVGSAAGPVARRLQQIARALDPALRVGRLRSLGEIYWQRKSVDNMVGLVLAAVMLIVLLFSMAGMYALMAFTVAQRWREIGLRSALGAPPRRLVAGIFGRALVPLAAGAVGGGLLALLIESNVQVTRAGGRNIPGVLPASAALMIVVGLFALIGPARRALRVDPAEALRDG